MHDNFKTYYDSRLKTAKRVKEKSKIIVGFAGIGKSHADKRFKNVIDLESGFFQFNLDPFSSQKEQELQKMTPRVSNEDGIQEYLEVISESLKHFDYVLIAQSPLIVYTLLMMNEYDIVFVSPKNHQKKEYLQRYYDRHNNGRFINWMDENFDQFIEQNKQLAKEFNVPFVELKKNQYLSDIIQSI